MLTRCRPIAFHPASVLFNTPNLPQLYESPRVGPMIDGIVDELLELARSLGCDFPADSRDKIIATMKVPPLIEGTSSVMYQDYLAKRPMEIETFLGSPIKLAKILNITLPRLEVVYALLHERNQRNLKGETPPSPGANPGLPPRTSSMQTGGRPPMNGVKNRGMANWGPPSTGPNPAMRRGPYTNGYRMGNGSVVNGFGPNGAQHSRRDSAEGEALEEFSHVMLYEGVPDGGFQDASSGSYGEPSGGSGTPSSSELALKERELVLRQREIELKEREHQMQMRRGGPPPRRQQRPPATQPYDDEDQEDDYFDPMSGGHGPGQVDDNIDMLSITSRRHRKMPSNGNYNHHPAGARGKNMYARKNRSSTRIMHDMPSPHESIMNNPLMGYSSNRYGTVDRQTLEAESRHNSMSGAKMEEIARSAQGNQYGPIRRPSQSPGNPLSPTGQRPSPPNGYVNGMRPGPPMMNGRPSPPGVRQPVPRHPPSHGNVLAPQPVEQHVGVSTLYPPKPNFQVRSLTGSASASAKTGDSASANTGSANSAASSSSSLQPRPHQILVAVAP